jgi:hypothetical protein
MKAKSSTKHKRTEKWFIKKRGSYLPSSWQGWLTYIPFIGYLVASYIVVNRNTSSISNVAFSLVPQWVVATVIMTWIAQRKS